MAVEQWTAQPHRAEGAAVGGTAGYTSGRPKPRTLTPCVGLQRWVLRLARLPLGNDHDDQNVVERCWSEEEEELTEPPLAFGLGRLQASHPVLHCEDNSEEEQRGEQESPPRIRPESVGMRGDVGRRRRQHNKADVERDIGNQRRNGCAARPKETACFSVRTI